MKIPSLSRRNFIAKTGLGAGLIMGAPAVLKAYNKTHPTDEIRVGFIGCGKQHEVLLNAMVNIAGIRYVAACDIMKARVGRTFSAIKSRFGYNIKRYLNAEEMLEKEKLDAVFVSTPDFWHAPHSVMAMEAGCAVYCEKMMSDTLEGARRIVAAMDQTGQLCQIGHQRRSNPRYRFALEQLISDGELFGQLVNINSQWNRALSSSQDIVSKPSILPDAKTLLAAGFDAGATKKLSLEELRHRFLNWRFYKHLSGGPISDLGAHQIDIFNWFLDTKPSSLMASGGRSYFKEREHFDNVMCLFDYETEQGIVRAFYQVLTTTSSGGGYYESFMGTNGTLVMSEREAYTKIYKESGADNEAQWNAALQRGLLKKVEARNATGSADAIAAYESAPPDEYTLPGGMSKAPHQPHIENFILAIRGQAQLTCDARHALESEAPIYWVNQAAETKQTIQFTHEHLHT